MLRCKRIALTVCLACVPAVLECNGHGGAILATTILYYYYYYYLPAVLERNGHGGAVFTALAHGDPTTAHRAREKRHALQGRVGARVRVRVRRTYCLGLPTRYLLLPTHYYLQEDDVLGLRR